MPISELFYINNYKSEDYTNTFSSAFYHILLFQGKGSFLVDATPYDFEGCTALFLSPYQQFQWQTKSSIAIKDLKFHGDFYCIEYHKKEVACNGLLFNNIYLNPYIQIGEKECEEITRIFKKIEDFFLVQNPHTEAIIKAYLQLILALCSSEKYKQIESKNIQEAISPDMQKFQQLLETNFLQEKTPSFYADSLAISVANFSRKTKQTFGKTPMQMIQDRVILEAKKRLHLTYKPIKQIAAELNFDDEFYFSRYFKKNVGLSPFYYRKKVGISVVATKD